MNKNYELAKSQIEEIRTLFLEGKNVSGIGKQLGIYPYNVAKVLEELKLYKKETKKDRAIAFNSHLQEIIDWYKNGQSLKKIVNNLKDCDIHTTQRTIKKLLIDNGVEIKQAKDYTKIYTSKGDAFSTYTPESCYWAGLLAADGCVYKHTKAKEVAYVTLSLKDKDSVCRFKDYIEFTGEVKERATQGANAYCLYVNNINICNDLRNNFNIVPNKSLIFSPSEKIPEELKKYFILGYLDGDGTITFCTTSTGRKQYLLSFVGTKNTLNYIKTYLGCEHLKLINPHGGKNNCYSLNIQGNQQLEKLLDNLYSNDFINNIAMERKYKRYLQLKRQNKEIHT